MNHCGLAPTAHNLGAVWTVGPMAVAILVAASALMVGLETHVTLCRVTLAAPSMGNAKMELAFAHKAGTAGTALCPDV